MMPLENTSFIHFNDVYNVERSPPFVSSVKKAKVGLEERGRRVFTFFSGDAFSPSFMSTILRGEQMLPVLNALSIDAACLGAFGSCILFIQVLLFNQGIYVL